MKNILIIICLTAFSISCGTAIQQTANANVSAQQNSVSAQTQNDSLVVSSHSSDAGKDVPAQTSKSDSSGASPMAKAIDVGKMTADIEKAEKSFKQNPKDEKAKNDLAEAYFVRAFALTEASQYRSALGDFRKGLKLNPNNADAKAMHDEIINIFENSLHREPPKEGEEPPPMPFNK